MTNDELQDQLHMYGLSRVADAIVESVRTGINITCHAANETDLPVGTSKIGGSPDLPRDVLWPDSEGCPMAFVAQMSMAEVAAYDVEGILPLTGLLSFFYNGSQIDRGNDWDVLYVKDEVASLERRSAPEELDEWSRFKSCAVDFTLVPLLPEPHTVSARSLELSDQEQTAYRKLCGDSPLCWNRSDNEQWASRLLGYPTNYDGDALLSSYEGFNERSAGVPLPNSKRMRAQLQEAALWRLLLQVSSESAADMDWDSGFIYYCIDQEALQARDFSDVWLTSQFL